MDAVTPIRLVEQFHLLFLAQLGRRVDKKRFVVKGGCNLRFFHRSIRYSEAMDLDLGDVDAHVFRDKVREIFASRPFAQILEARGIRIDHATEHEQTDTTQRWKLALRVEGAAVSLASGGAAGAVEDLDRRVAQRAGANAMTVDFGMFKSQVLAYLPPDDQAHYDSSSIWDTIVLEVVDALRMGRP
jgi:hypothetical protein